VENFLFHNKSLRARAGVNGTPPASWNGPVVSAGGHLVISQQEVPGQKTSMAKVTPPTGLVQDMEEEPGDR